MELNEGWAPLCRTLNLLVPEQPFPALKWLLILVELFTMTFCLYQLYKLGAFDLNQTKRRSKYYQTIHVHHRSTRLPMRSSLNMRPRLTKETN